MIVNSITPKCTQNVQAQKQNINFQGNLGNKFVNDIIKGADVQPDVLIKEMKGTFGIKTDKAEDILESFISKVKGLFKENNNLSKMLYESEKKVNSFPREKQDAIWDAEQKMRESFQSAIQRKNSEIETKNEEIAKLKKYEQVTKVKSIEEIDAIMPDKAIELIDEMIKNKIPARKSMADFLLTGKGQEDALKQIERNNMLMKGHRDDITAIPEVDAQVIKMRKSGIYFSDDSYFTLNMIEKALKGTKQGSYLISPVIKKQVKENAMAILAPMANEKYSTSNIRALSDQLDERLNHVVKYHKGLTKGIEKMKQRSDFSKVEYKPVKYSPEDSKVVMYSEDKSTFNEENYQWLANYGNSSW